MSDTPVVVIGGVPLESGANSTSTNTVRELARTRDVLYICTEARGGLEDRVATLARRPGRAVRASFGVRLRPVAPRVTAAAVSGAWTLVPSSSPEWVRRRHVRAFRRTIMSWLAARDADSCVLVLYWWFLPELVELVPHERAVYDCIDEHLDYPGSPLRKGRIEGLEGETLDAVDRSFVVTPALLGRREGPGRDVVVLPNAFNRARYDALRSQRRPPPAPLRGVRGPVVGYVGGLGERLDMELLLELFARRPDWTWVFIGAGPPEALRCAARRPNVILLDVLPYADVLAAVDRFDVATIPFVDRAFTRGNSFLKLLDYLAGGTPVVATPLPDTRAVDAAETGLLRLARGVDDWVAQLDAALAEPRDDSRRAARRHYVGRRSVERRTAILLGDERCERAESGVLEAERA